VVANNEFILQIAKALRSVGSEQCKEAAKSLKRSGKQGSLIDLHLRNLGLEAFDAFAIGKALEGLIADSESSLKSISLSYNKALGSAGAIALAKALPSSIREIGLVGCGIGDMGGIKLLEWVRNAPKLQMICVEQNYFSEPLKMEFLQLSKRNPTLTVMI
jgi:hypothetical protein